MPHTNAYIYKAMRLASQAGKKAHVFRQSAAKLTQLRERFNHWSSIFDPGHVLTSGIAFFGLAVIDCCLLMPMYRQLSEVALNDPTAISLEIAVGMVCLAAVCSSSLAQAQGSGPFYRWNIYQHRDGMTALEFEHNGARWLTFGIVFSCYCTILGVMAWVRSTVIDDSKLLVEKIEPGLILIGVLVSFCAIICGRYLAPMIDYLTMQAQSSTLVQRKHTLLQQVMKADQYVYLVWAHHGSATNLSREMRDAIIRHKTRPANDAYCDEITLMEEQGLENYLRLD